MTSDYTKQFIEQANKLKSCLVKLIKINTLPILMFKDKENIVVKTFFDNKNMYDQDIKHIWFDDCCYSFHEDGINCQLVPVVNCVLNDIETRSITGLYNKIYFNYDSFPKPDNGVLFSSLVGQKNMLFNINIYNHRYTFKYLINDTYVNYYDQADSQFPGEVFKLYDDIKNVEYNVFLIMIDLLKPYVESNDIVKIISNYYI